MKTLLPEKRKPGIKWSSIEEAKRGLSGTPECVERHANARMKAQDLFIKIRSEKIK